MGTCCCQGVDEMFGERTARHDLRRYRKRGPSKPTRVLLAALRREGIESASVLDIGGGIGAIQNELLDAGADRVTSVEASRRLHARGQGGGRATRQRWPRRATTRATSSRSPIASSRQT